MGMIVFFITLIASCVLALYVGGWCMFLEPIISFAHAFDADAITGSMIIGLLVKVAFASPVAGIIIQVGALIASKLYDAFEK